MVVLARHKMSNLIFKLYFSSLLSSLFILVYGNVIASLSGVDYDVFCIAFTDHGSSLHTNVAVLSFPGTQPNNCGRYSVVAGR
jgi:hypothetical protein